MDLKFKPRTNVDMTTKAVHGFDRDLIVTTDDGVEHLYSMSMATGPTGTRSGRIKDAAGKVVWEGPLPDGPPPTRAFAVAAGLCDDDGNSNIPAPAWVK